MAADKLLVDAFVTSNPSTIEVMYTSPSNSSAGGTLIKAFTASNITGINASYVAYIVGTSGDTSQPDIPFQVVTRFKSDLAAAIVNQIIPKGGTLRVETSAAGAITFRVSGIEL